jgi:hypothetical protein
VKGIEYPYTTAEPQKTGWPLTAEERAYVDKPEHDRRPGRESNKHLPAMWPIVPAAGYWGGTAWLDTHAKLVNYVQANKGLIDILLVGDSIAQQWGSPLDKGVLDLWNDFTNADGTLKTELYSDQHLHLGPAGYDVLAAKLKSVVAKLTEPPGDFIESK